MSKPQIFAFPARVLKRAPTEELKRLVRANRYVEEGVFDELEPFFFQAEVSNNTLDSWFTRMSTSSLKNYAADAKAGVSLQDSHNARRLGIGRSLSGKYEKDGEVERVLADFYTVRGLKFNDATYQSSDDFINAIRTGIASDVSVGFYGGMYICSVCQMDMMDWNGGCMHWPGDEVEIKDADGKTIGKEIVFAWVADARLSEVSLVYDGATPGAGILKAERAIEEGILKPDRIHILEERYRVKLPDARRLTAVGDKPQEVNMADNDNGAQTRAAVLSEVRAALIEAGRKPEGDVLAFLRLLKPEGPAAPSQDAELGSHLRQALDAGEAGQPEQLKGFRALSTKEGVTTLVALASDGKRYRADLIEDALKEGVRARGTEFAQDQYRATLESSSIDTIKRFRNDWKAIADISLSGGRKTVDNEETPTPVRENKVPDAAFIV